MPGRSPPASAEKLVPISRLPFQYVGTHNEQLLSHRWDSETAPKSHIARVELCTATGSLFYAASRVCVRLLLGTAGQTETGTPLETVRSNGTCCGCRDYRSGNRLGQQ